MLHLNRALALFITLSLASCAHLLPHNRKLLEVKEFNPHEEALAYDLEDDDDTYTNQLELTIQRQTQQSSEDEMDEWLAFETTTQRNPRETEDRNMLTGLSAHLDVSDGVDVEVTATAAPYHMTTAATIQADPSSSDRSRKADSNLQTLVENQMASYFPQTSEQQSEENAGLVQKSFLAALRNDMGNMLDDSWLPVVPEGTKAVTKSGDTESEDALKNLDLKTFFGQYDFEVDADMMQEKIVGLLQQATMVTDIKDTGDAAGSSPAAHIEEHFHVSADPTTSPVPMLYNHTCRHNFMDIFKKFDFEVDAEEVETQINNLHEVFVNSKSGTQASDKPQPTYLKVSSAVNEKHIKVDASDLDHDKDQELPPPSYFDVQAMDRLNNESVEEFYNRFLGMRGTVIHNVVVM